MNLITEIQPDTVAFIPASDVCRSWRSGEAIVVEDPERITYRPLEATDVEIVRHVVGDTDMFTVFGDVGVHEPRGRHDGETRRSRLAIWEAA